MSNEKQKFSIANVFGNQASNNSVFQVTRGEQPVVQNWKYANPNSQYYTGIKYNMNTALKPPVEKTADSGLYVDADASMMNKALSDISDVPANDTVGSQNEKPLEILHNLMKSFDNSDDSPLSPEEALEKSFSRIHKLFKK